MISRWTLCLLQCKQLLRDNIPLDHRRLEKRQPEFDRREYRKHFEKAPNHCCDCSIRRIYS